MERVPLVPHVARFGLVVDLGPWPAPVDGLVVERLGAPLRDRLGTVRTWHPLREDGDAKGAAAATDEALVAVILSGSVSMVEDDTPWMRRLGEHIAAWCDRDIPILGTCFGHQFLAHHFGGQISSFQQRRVTMAPLTVRDPSDRLMADLPNGELLWAHRDYVADVPAALQVTAGSAEVPVEAFRHRTHRVWGIQAHPETDAALAQAIARVDEDAADRIRRHPWRAYDGPAGRHILARFADIAKATAY